MLWNIIKGVVAAVLVTKITERYFKEKGATAPVQLDLDMPARPRRVRTRSAAKRDAEVDAPLDTAVNNPQNATESTI